MCALVNLHEESPYVTSCYIRTFSFIRNKYKNITPFPFSIPIVSLSLLSINNKIRIMNIIKIDSDMSEKELTEVFNNAFMKQLVLGETIVFEINGPQVKKIMDLDKEETVNITLDSIKDIEVENEEYVRFNDLDFGEAILALEHGHMIARSGWNGQGMFVFKQIPANIPIKAVAGMQSLPPSVKAEFIAREADTIRKRDVLGGKINLDTGSIKYSNQLAIVDINNNIKGWAPSTSDALANDWFIVFPKA